jgi:hypothetical protein
MLKFIKLKKLDFKYMNDQNSIWYVVLGAGLALVTSLSVEVYKQWVSNKNNEKDFKIILKLEVKGILRLRNSLMITVKDSFICSPF